MLPRRRTLAALAGLLLAVPSVGHAAEPRLLSAEELARTPEMSAAQLSPDGRRLATVEAAEARFAVVLRTLATGERTPLYRDPDRPLLDLRWSTDGRWLTFLKDAGGDEGFHLYRLDTTKPGPPTDLTPFAGVAVERIAAPALPAGIALITMNRRDPAFADAFAVDLATGALTERVRNDGRFTELFADAQGRILAATGISAAGELLLYGRPSASAPWQERYRAGADERFRLLSLAWDGRQAIARTNRGREQEELVRIDLETGAVKPEDAHACGRFDVEGVTLGPTGVLAIHCVQTHADVIARSPDLGAAVARARRFVGAEAGLWLESHSAGGPVVFYSDAGDQPGRFLLDRGEAGVEVLAETRPWLRGAPLARPEPHWLEARDGLPLLTYVTRPPGAAGPGPAVIAIHGGPWTRDAGGFETDTQFLANRGYTVIQVNFRGSTGLGRKVFEGGIGEFGGKMSDDLDDAYAWAVRRGWVDPARVCLLGGSYGGFAVLAGLTRAGSPYRCGLDYAGPVDLVTLVESFLPSWKAFLPRSWYRFVGNPERPAERAAMSARSPIHALERIRQPLLVFQGANDPRVTQAQSDRLVCSLRARSIPVEYLLAAQEGHSFGQEETRLAVLRAAELFLAQHLGGRALPTASERTEDALRTLRAGGSAIACPSG